MTTATKKAVVQIKLPNWQAIRFRLEGTSPYLQAPRKRSKPYTSPKGWHGIPTVGLREALIRAAPHVSRIKTWTSSVKICVYVEPDGFDADDGMALVRIKKGRPVPFADAEAKWEKDANLYESWQADVVIRYDADVFGAMDVVQLVQSAGVEIGIGGHKIGNKGEFGSFSAAPA